VGEKTDNVAMVIGEGAGKEKEGILLPVSGGAYPEEANNTP